KDKDKRKIADTPVAEPEDRPIGVKAAKAAGKRKKTGKDEELTKLEGLMEMKKQISRQRSVEDMCEMKTKDGVSSLFSHGMGDEVDRRLNAALDKAVDEYFEDTYNNIVKNQTKKQSKRAYVERNREEGHTRLWNDYFSENPTFLPHLFRGRFRMNKAVFMRIVDRLSENFPFFQQRRDALSPLQKCTAAVRMLAYGCAADAVDEYLRLGSIDCMHWEWKNCPTAWKGQYTCGSGKPTIVLETVASQDLWIWHAFFGPPGTLNDINVLDRSPVFDDILQGRAPRVHYVVNGHQYDLAYYLTYGIYPKWSTFIQSISNPQGPEAELFAKVQEATRKDAERAFGVLQARFVIVKNPAILWDKRQIGMVMRTYV
uniref:DDE Tnp4 domain-containing protein n=1 Tax=Brassica oleracea var. oleracea TaxID=109376 RepID=A0A0D3B677_BRAOL